MHCWSHSGAFAAMYVVPNVRHPPQVLARGQLWSAACSRGGAAEHRQGVPAAVVPRQLRPLHGRGETSLCSAASLSHCSAWQCSGMCLLCASVLAAVPVPIWCSLLFACCSHHFYNKGGLGQLTDRTSAQQRHWQPTTRSVGGRHWKCSRAKTPSQLHIVSANDMVIFHMVSGSVLGCTSGKPAVSRKAARKQVVRWGMPQLTGDQ